MNSELDGICQDCFRYSKVQDKIDTLEKTIEYAKRIEKDYKTKVDKAIEYIQNNTLYSEDYDYDDEDNLQFQGAYDYKAREDLLEILKGSDKE